MLVHEQVKRVAIGLAAVALCGAVNGSSALAQTNGSLDLEIVSLAVSPVTPTAGSNFYAYVFSRNSGSVPVSNIALTVWANHPVVASCGETSSASAWIPGLQPGGMATNAFVLTAPSATGTALVLRAFVDTFCIHTESNEANNQGTLLYATTGGSTNPPPLPDLRVTSITLSPAKPKPGKLFTAYVTVQNAGSAAASNARIASWAHSPSAVSCGATGNSEVVIASLAAGVSQTTTHTLRAPSGIATGRVLRAFADRSCAIAESNESNNQSTSTY